MTYLPTLELTPQVRMMLSRGALRLQPGQWVRENGRAGRYLRTNPNTGVSYFSWARPGEDVEAYARRFRRACVKGYVGRYRGLYDPDRKAYSRALAAAVVGDGPPPLDWEPLDWTRRP